MSDKLKAVVIRDRRLIILKLLASAECYALNDRVLRIGLREWGDLGTPAQVRTELAWLGEQGLIAVETLGDGTLVATALEAGVEVAAGRSVNPGVSKPEPRHE